MTILCSTMGHCVNAQWHRNQGLEFSLCDRCGCDLIRNADEGGWIEVPNGFRVVWREFGRVDDAASVAARMGRMAQPAARTSARGGPAAPRRSRRGRPLAGAASMVGALTRLGKLIPDDVRDDVGIDANGQYVICLPYAGAN